MRFFILINIDGTIQYLIDNMSFFHVVTIHTYLQLNLLLK